MIYRNIPPEAISASRPLSSSQGLWKLDSFSGTGYIDLLPWGSSWAGKTSVPQIEYAATAVTIPAKPVGMS